MVEDRISVSHSSFFHVLCYNTLNRNEKNVFVNGAVPATTTEYLSECALEHIGTCKISIFSFPMAHVFSDEEVDIVIVEMGINDPR